MYYVYILRSQSSLGKFYVGSTADLRRRMRQHACAKSGFTSKHSPWSLETYIAFADRSKALRFERYLKSGSGRVFSLRHF